MAAGALLACLTLAGAGCGSNPVPSGRQPTVSSSAPPASTAASATSPASTPYVAVEVGGTSSPAVHIVDLTGKLVASAPLSAATGVTVAGVGSHGVYLAGPGHQLSRLEVNGKVHSLESTPAGDAGELAGLAESADGSQWAYSLVSFANDAAMTATTRVYVASTGSSPRVVAQLKRADLTNAGASERYAGGYAVLRWDSAGLLLGSRPTGVGGVGPFISESYGLDNVVRLDPGTGQTSPRLSPTGCRFGDVAPDGTVACLSSGGITVAGAAGSSATVAVPGLQSDHPAGAIAFVGGSGTVVYEVATFSDAAQPTWGDALMVARASGGGLSSTTVPGSLNSRGENGRAWSDVVDANTVAVIVGPADGPKLALLAVNSATMVTLGPADAIDGVMHAAS